MNVEREKAIASAVVERLRAADCPKTWMPRLWTQEIGGGRTLVRVYLGAGSDSFAYVTTDDRVRLSGSVPVRWRPELTRILGDEMGLLEVVRGAGGMVPRRESVAKQPKAVRAWG